MVIWLLSETWLSQPLGRFLNEILEYGKKKWGQTVEFGKLQESNCFISVPDFFFSLNMKDINYSWGIFPITVP